MKKLLVLVIFTCIHLSSLAQKDVFRIDSIPAKGILLDKGWKWHAGDNPDFAKPDFDDSQWQSIDPTVDVMDLPQISKKGGVLWFRLDIKIDTSLINQIISLMINQTGASEIYINEQLVSKFGKISTDSDKILSYNPSGNPITINLNEIVHTIFRKQTKQVLSIRFAFQPNIFFTRIWNRPNPALKIHLNRADKIVNNSIYKEAYFTFADYFRGGMFFILGLLHLVLFSLDRKQKTNLYAGYYYIFGTVFFLCHTISYQHILILSTKMYILTLSQFVTFGMSLTTLLIVYNITNYQKGIVFWLLVFFVVGYFPLCMWNYRLSGILALLFPVLMNLEVIKVSISAVIQKKRDSWLILAGVVGFTLFYLLGLLMTNLGDNTVTLNIIIKNLFYNLSFLSFPICVTIILAREFAKTSKSLESKLIEVQQLSEEKQEALLKQNTELQAALLQGQTIERKRVAADLHDNLGSTMSSLIYTVNAIDIQKLDDDEKGVYQNLKQMLDTAYNEIRLLSHNLLPEEFEKQGLAETLKHFVRKINQTKAIQFDLSIDPKLERLPPKIEFELYSICLELINNILKHSKATQAQINLSAPALRGSDRAADRPNGEVKLIVSDNGIGFFENDFDGKGIKNVRARVESLNGTWKSKDTENHGITNIISIPL